MFDNSFSMKYFFASTLEHNGPAGVNGFWPGTIFREKPPGKDDKKCHIFIMHYKAIENDPLSIFEHYKVLENAKHIL